MDVSFKAAGIYPDSLIRIGECLFTQTKVHINGASLRPSIVQCGGQFNGPGRVGNGFIHFMEARIVDEGTLNVVMRVRRVQFNGAVDSSESLVPAAAEGVIPGSGRKSVGLFCPR